MQNNSNSPISGPAFRKPAADAFANDAELAAWIHQTVHDLQPGMGPKDLGFQAAAMLLAGFIVGADELKIGRLLGYSSRLVTEIARNLRDFGVWKGTKACDTAWFHNQCGRVAFLSDSLVALGLVERVEDPVGGLPHYNPRFPIGQPAETYLASRCSRN